MRGFVTLLGKEWRDARPIAVASMLLAGGATFLLPRAFEAQGEYAGGAAQYIVPGIVALFVALIAADLVSVEVQTRRVAAMALLPTRLSTVWAAKATLLALVSTVFVAWIVECQVAALWLLRSDEAALDFVQRLSREAWQLGAIAAIGFATLFVSTLIERSFVCLLLGLGAGVGAVAGAVYGMGWLVAGFQPSSTTVVGQLAGAAAVMFAVASLAAFTKGRIQTGARLRRVVVGLVALVACLVPARAAVAAWTKLSWLAITPGDPSACIQQISPSADGRWLAMQVGKMEPVRRQLIAEASQVWLIDIEDGSLRVPETLRAFGPNAWDADGRLVGYDRPGAALIECHVDPLSLVTVSEEKLSIEEIHSRWGASATHWYSLTSEVDQTAPKGFAIRSKVHWTDRGISAPFEGKAYCFAEPGIVFHHASAFRLACYDMATGDDRTVLEDERGIGRVTFNLTGTRFLATIEGSEYAFDTASGRRLGGPWTRESVSWPWGRAPDRYLQERVTEPAPPHFELIDVDTGRRIQVGAAPGNGYGWPSFHETPAGAIVRRADGNIDLLDQDGAVVRRLYAVHESRGN